MDRQTVSCTLWHWLLASTATDTDTVDDITLLGLITKTAGLVWTRWSGRTVNDVQLAKLYFALSAMFNECIAETRKCPQYVYLRPRKLDCKVAAIEVFGRGVILPPSSGHGEGNEAHRTASSSAALRRI